MSILGSIRKCCFLSLIFILLFILNLSVPLLADDDIRVEIVDVRDVSIQTQAIVPVQFDNANPDLHMGAFDLQISFSTLMSLVNVDYGTLLTDCGWEDLQYSLIDDTTVSIHGSAGSAATCNIGIANGNLVDLTFFIEDGLDICDVYPVRFSWFDCNDNIFWNIAGDTAFVVSSVKDYYYRSTLPMPENLPSLAGIPNSCLSELQMEVNPILNIAFTSGKLIESNSSAGGCPGDLNLNGLPCDYEDLLIYSDYFVYGPPIFIINQPAQIANSDVNNDGRVLTVADLIYMLHVIVPEILDPDIEEGDTAVFIQNLSQNNISLDYPDTIFMATLYFDDEIEIQSLAPNLTIIESPIEHHFIVAPIDPGLRTGLVPGTILSYSGPGLLFQVDGCMDYNDLGIPSAVAITEDPSCGDANGDDDVNVSDAVYIVNYVFTGGFAPDPLQSGDCNCDGVCNVSDAVWLINFVFAGGSQPCDTNGDDFPDC